MDSPCTRRPVTMRIVDAHHHLWDLGVRDQDWITGAALAPLRRDFLLDDYQPLAEQNGVGASVVVQTVTVPGETPELLALAATSDLIAGVVGWADLTAPGLTDRIAELTALPGGDKLVGLRHQVQSEPDPQWLTRADVLRGLAAVAGAGLVYDLVITPGQLGAAAQAAAAVPDLLFVLDHLGKPAIASGSAQPWERDLRRLAALPNTACQAVRPGDRGRLDPLAGRRPASLRRGRPRRLRAGPGDVRLRLAGLHPGRELRRGPPAARDLTWDLSVAEREAIFAGTASRVYRLGR